MMVVSYPLNPVCATAPDEFYDKLIAFAKKYNIILFTTTHILRLYMTDRLVALS